MESERMGHNIWPMHYKRTRCLHPLHLFLIHLLLLAQTLITLNLSLNQIGASAAQYLADALRENKVSHHPGSSVSYPSFSLNTETQLFVPCQQHVVGAGRTIERTGPSNKVLIEINDFVFVLEYN